MMLPSRSPSTRSRSPSRRGTADPRRARRRGLSLPRPAARGGRPDPAAPVAIAAYAGVPALIGTTSTDEDVPS